MAAGRQTAGRQTTVLFAGVTGSADLYATAGDLRAVEEITRCLEAFRRPGVAGGP